MAFVVKDRVKESSTTTGTGTLTLAGADTDFQSFAAIGNNNTTFYTISLTESDEWEVGIGTYTASGTTFSRDTVLASSNSGSLVNFSAGDKEVFCTYPAGRALYTDDNGDTTAKHIRSSQGIFLTAQTITENYTLDASYNGMTAGPITINTDVAVTVPSGSTWVIV
jgi:hypothetical protein